MRKVIVDRKREKEFNISYRIDDKPLPTYNALHDPYLSGFFDKPQIKHHLKQMHLIKPKRKNKSSTKRPRTTSKSHATDKHSFKLPMIDDILGQRQINPQRREARTAATSQRKRKSMYRSNQEPEAL